jgi:hypothetical protein
MTMGDRAQVSGGPWVAGGVIVGVIVLAVVVDEAREQVAAVDGPVKYCGLCGADWTPVASLLIIAALVAIAAHTVSFVKWPPEEERDE